MPILVRQDREKRVRPDHPVFSGEQTLIDRDREQNMPRVRKMVIAIIAVAILLAVIVAGAIIQAMVRPTADETSIVAADTFSLTQYEQEQMAEKARRFAEGMLLWEYCSDQDRALQGKNAALSLMASNTEAYTIIENARQSYPVIPFSSFAPIVNEPRMTSVPGVAFTSSVTFEFDAAAADLAVKSEQNPNGTFADAGLSFKVEFAQADDEAMGTRDWMISNVTVTSIS